jgi:hypothetical protein
MEDKVTSGGGREWLTSEPPHPLSVMQATHRETSSVANQFRFGRLLNLFPLQESSRGRGDEELPPNVEIHRTRIRQWNRQSEFQFGNQVAAVCRKRSIRILKAYVVRKIRVGFIGNARRTTRFQLVSRYRYKFSRW